MDDTSEKIRPIESADKIDKLISSLQEYVVKGRFKPGMELPPERELARQFGVSRFSLREALRVAKSQGLIEIQRGRCPRIAQPSTEPLSNLMGLTFLRAPEAGHDLIEARKVLECQIAFLAAQRADSQNIEQLYDTITCMQNNEEDTEQCVQKDVEFHNILVEATGNSVFRILMDSLPNLLERVRYQVMKECGVARAIESHHAIYEAIKEKQPAQAAQAMQRHLEMAEEDTTAMFAKII